MIFNDGQSINRGRYTVLNCIGSGGFGITYLAQDNKHNRSVVIKTLNVLSIRQMYANPPNWEDIFNECQEKFVNEALVLATFDHPHIVKIYPQMFQESGLWCMVMDYVKGQNLIQVIEEKGVFSEADGLRIIQEIGEALSYIHSKNHLHRDIKPQNILLRKQDNKAILIDFGLAREVDFAQSMTLTSGQTPAYAPPEQFVQRDRFTPALDVYSLAATLYVLLAVHESPFIPLPSPYLNAKIMLDMKMEIKPPKSLNSVISQRVNHAILQGMALDVNQRPKSVEAWFELLGIDPPQPPLIRGEQETVKHHQVSLRGTEGGSKIQLISRLGFDYTKLEQLLAAEKWGEANGETNEKLLKVMGRDSWYGLRLTDLNNFSEEDLRIMDSLWVKYSNGRFGFSVQKEIWIACGGTPGVLNGAVYEKFSERMGWRKRGNWIGLTLNTSAPKGHLPSCWFGGDSQWWERLGGHSSLYLFLS